MCSFPAMESFTWKSNPGSPQTVLRSHGNTTRKMDDISICCVFSSLLLHPSSFSILHLLHPCIHALTSRIPPSFFKESKCVCIKHKQLVMPYVKLTQNQPGI